MATRTEAPTLLTEADHPQVARLFYRVAHQHLHLDWRRLEEWLPDPNLRCWVGRRNGTVRSVLGATLHVPPARLGVAWLRLILPPAPHEYQSMNELWHSLQDDLRARSVRQVAVMALDAWVGELAATWGFARTNAVITLRRSQGVIPPPPAPPYRIREIATYADLDAVVQLDSQAFDPLWQYSRDTLNIAGMQAATFTVLENRSELLGYQLSTRHPGSGHLARLAIRPDQQGRGLAGLLVGEVLRFMEARGIWTVTVNTQEDNLRSQRLYARLGFERTGHAAPVWTIDL